MVPGDEYIPYRASHQGNGAQKSTRSNQRANVCIRWFPGEIETTVTLFDVHSGDKGIAKLIGMVHDLIHKKFAFAIMNYLVNFYDPSISIIWTYAYRLNVRIEDRPLASPVLAHAFMSIDEAALHPVRPDDIGTHPGEDGVEAACVEIAVSAFEEFAVVAHSGRSLVPY